MKSQIHLIRHGITEGNQRRLYYGATDLPLSQEGIEQIARLVKEGVYPTADESDFYTTGLRRTEQTLALIYGETRHEQICQLKEMSFGEFEMKSYEELKEVPEYIQWISDESGRVESPGGESISGFASRISQGMKVLMEKHRHRELAAGSGGKDAVSTVICHGGTIASIMEECFAGQREHFYRWIPDPGHGYTLELEEGSVTGYTEF